MNGYDIDIFVQELNSLILEERPPRMFLEAAAECVRKLVAGSLFLDDHQLNAVKDTPQRRVLYEEPSGHYTLYSVCWPPGYKTPIHDHGTWGLLVGYRARIHVTTYRRLDDGEEEGVAQLNEVSRQLVSEGGVTALIRPPEEEAHRVENPYNEAAMTVQLVGDDQPWPHLYNLEDNSYAPAAGENQRD